VIDNKTARLSITVLQYKTFLRDVSRHFQRMLPHPLSCNHHQPLLADDSPYGTDYDTTHTADCLRRNLRSPTVEAVYCVEPLLLPELLVSMTHNHEAMTKTNSNTPYNPIKISSSKYVEKIKV